jgi:hypothetical protein
MMNIRKDYIKTKLVIGMRNMSFTQQFSKLLHNRGRRGGEKNFRKFWSSSSWGDAINRIPKTDTFLK